MKLIKQCIFCGKHYESEGTPDTTTSEMIILRKFVEEFSPFHANMANELNYEELTNIVKDIAEEF